MKDKIILFSLFFIPIIFCDSNNTKLALERINIFCNLNKENYEENIEEIAIIFNTIYADIERKATDLKKYQEDAKYKLNEFNENFLINEIEKSMEITLFFYDLIYTNVSACTKFQSFHRMFNLYTFVYDYNLRINEQISSFEKFLQKIGTNNEDKEFSQITKELLNIMKLNQEFLADFQVANLMLKKVLFKYSEIFSFDEECLEKFPCGTFIPYNPLKDKYAPLKNGFKAGQWFDNTDVYVGAGFVKDPSTGVVEKETIGRLSISSSNPGVILEDSHEVFDNKSCFYLLNHKNLKWINYSWVYGKTFPVNFVTTAKIIFQEGVGRYNMSKFVNIGHVMKYSGFLFSVEAEENSRNLTLSEKMEKDFGEIENLLEIDKENYEKNILKIEELFTEVRENLYAYSNLLFRENLNIAEKFNTNNDDILQQKLKDFLSKTFVLYYDNPSSNATICYKYLDFHEQLKLNILYYFWLHKYFYPVCKLEKVFHAIAESSEDEEMKEYSKQLETLTCELEEFLKCFDRMIKLLTILVKMFLKIFEYEDCLEKLPCGIFIPYDVENDIEAPKKYGFSAGKYFDETEAFVGTGYIHDPKTKIKDVEIPGRISINSTSAFIHLDDYNDILSNQTVFYLLKNENLKWINFSSNSNDSFPTNTVGGKVLSKNFYNVCRFNFSEYTNIGSSHLKNFYIRVEKKYFKVNNVELLICDETN
ncbi:hypothetical protein PVAND_014510 [Polypedilum vanderplanki]|uniref:Uncharacterized protein n=1 Tax=Polypedilum vanderplanki TaxID=319348 RepID=A0A9J6BAE2_POLVA|nr:hypothetical protein PVAND_014510 [Polypedilum vanderplanki]